ncbi:MAG: hypothetical protein IT429_04785 [Gemmataceae bacterium]|nr:hypothetical protein [Gemmataceae bacterium]
MGHSFGRTALFSICVYLCSSVTPSARAALDPEAETLYPLRVVLHVADHRLLTPIFQDRLERELGDYLTAAYGKLARVEVVRGHPLLKDIRARGLQALDSWDAPSAVKTHFVLVDYADGQYRLQARQHDGWTGLCSPVVRRDETPDRQLVALAAARLVDRDFGLAGTVTKVEGETVEVTLRGGGLGVPVGRWVRRGEVFAVTRVTEEAGRRRAARLEWVLLQVRDVGAGGVCRCQLFHRYREDRLGSEPGVLGYRCLKLTTERGSLRLRLVNEETGMFLNGALVRVSRAGFGSKGEERVSGADGLVTTAEQYRDVAFAQILIGGAVRAKLPVEIVDDRVVVARVNVSAQAVAAGQLMLRKDRWIRRTYEGLSVIANRFAELNRALDRSPEAALALARTGREALKAETASLADEHDQLVKSAANLPGGLDLRAGEQQLQQLQEQGRRLEEFIGRLDKLVREANSPETRELQATLERARLKEGEADYETAIQLYEAVLRNRKDQADVKSHLEKLKAAWAIEDGDTAHAQARDFVVNTWPRLTVAEVAAQLPKAAAALKVLVSRKDRLTPQKLLRANIDHAKRLRKELEVLRFAADSEDNRARTKVLVRAAEQLQALHPEVHTFLKKDKPAGT